MPFVSIRARLILLSVFLLAVLALSSALLTRELARDSQGLAEEARLVSIVQKANIASKHFGDLKYWVIDAAETRLDTSLRRANAAKAQFERDLKAIAPVDPAGVAGIGREVDALMQLAHKAADAYASDESAVGDALRAQAQSQILKVDGEIGKIVDQVEQRALDRRDASMHAANTAVNLSIIGGIVALALAVILTTLIVRSINVPLRRLERGMAAITRGELDVALPRPGRDEIGAMTRTLGMLRDSLAERDRLERERQRAEAELRVTLDNMGDGVVMFDRDTRLAAWNRNFQQIFDLPDEFFMAPKNYPDYLDALRNRGEFGQAEEQARLNGNFENTERRARFEYARPDGRIVEVRHNPVPNGGFVQIYSDITERKRAVEAIHAARDAAEAALRELKTAQASLIQSEKMASLGQLTAGIAHEIKNPLNFVNNFASLSHELLQELKDIATPALQAIDEGRRAELDEVFDMLSGNLAKITEHGHRADGIVRSMLLHSRGGSGDRQTVDLNALVEEALNLAYHGARAQDQNFNITLEREFDRALAPIELVPQDMTRVFLNLFGNGFYAATKRARAAEAGYRPMLTVTTRDLGASVEVKVRDNGIGIAPEYRDKLFQPFFTTKPTGEGTGLGLSISYDIVTQQHDGSITVDSQMGEFTEFTVRLPRSRYTAAGERAA